MQLQALTLRDYRNLAEADLALGEGFTVLHGHNGAGKTNILEAVSMLSPGRGLRRAGADELIRRPEGLGWKVTANSLISVTSPAPV